MKAGRIGSFGGRASFSDYVKFFKKGADTFEAMVAEEWAIGARGSTARRTWRCRKSRLNSYRVHGGRGLKMLQVNLQARGKVIHSESELREEALKTDR